MASSNSAETTPSVTAAEALTGLTTPPSPAEITIGNLSIPITTPIVSSEPNTNSPPQITDPSVPVVETATAAAADATAPGDLSPPLSQSATAAVDASVDGTAETEPALDLEPLAALRPISASSNAPVDSAVEVNTDDEEPDHTAVATPVSRRRTRSAFKGASASTTKPSKAPKAKKAKTEALAAVPAGAAKTPASPKFFLSFDQPGPRSTLKKLQGKEPKPCKTACSETLTALGLLDAVTAAFTAIAWLPLLFLSLPIYKELVYEFYASLELNHAYSSYEEKGTLKFRLHGKHFNWSLDDLNRALGVEDSSEKMFDALPADFDAPKVYRELCNNDPRTPAWKTGDSRESYIHEPHLRYCHRILAFNYTGRTGSSGCLNEKELHALHCMKEGRKLHLGAWLLKQFQFVLSTANAPNLGAVISILAHGMDHFDPSGYTVLPAPAPLNTEAMLRMKMVEEVEDGVFQMLPPGPPEGWPTPAPAKKKPQAQLQPQQAPLPDSEISSAITGLTAQLEDFRKEFKDFASETRSTVLILRKDIETLMLHSNLLPANPVTGTSLDPSQPEN